MYKNKKIIVLIMAAGNGSRLGASEPKQFLDVGGEPMILKAARAFDERARVDDVWAVAAPGRLTDADAALGVLPKYRGSVPGSASRQESVRLGLAAAAVRYDGGRNVIALIHDAARPFVAADVIDRAIEGAAASGAAVACVPAIDTIYISGGGPERDGLRVLSEVPPRGSLWSAQTPQGFDLDMILAAHEAAAADGFEATDDGAVARAYGRAAGSGRRVDVLITMGDYANRKITMPEDLYPAIRAAAPRSTAAKDAGSPGAVPGTDDRVGVGFDVHAFVPDDASPRDAFAPSGTKAGPGAESAGSASESGRKLVLGGVAIPYARALEGHSDADVLTHALMDAMLGALALGDIGKFFPDTDERYRGVSSVKLLAEVNAMIGRKGYAVYNADMTIVAERPRVAGYADEIRDSLAAALGADCGRIGVKATTTEGLGFTGREEGIGAQAVVRLVRK